MVARKAWRGGWLVPRKLCRGSYSYICSSVHPVNVTIHSSCNNYLNHQSKRLLINRTIISHRVFYTVNCIQCMLIFSHSQAVWPSEVKDLSCMSHLFIFGFKVLYKFCLNLEERQNFILMGFFFCSLI